MCRYVLLYKFGGFYMDLDIECHKPMDALRAYPFIMPQTRPIGFSNDFLASTPGEASPSSLRASQQKHVLPVRDPCMLPVCTQELLDPVFT